MGESHYKIIILCCSLLINEISCEAMNITSLCLHGCQLLSNPELPCYSHSAFVPSQEIEIIDIDKEYINQIIQKILYNDLYYCFDPNDEIINFAQNAGTVQQSGNGGIFDLDSPVLIWQAIVISIIVPLMAFLLFKVVVLLCNKCCDTTQCQQQDKCCCLYLCSAQYRQRRRNRKFHNEIYNNPNNNDLHNDDDNGNNNKWWKFNRKKNDNLQQNDYNEAAVIVAGDDDNNDEHKNNGEDGIDLVLENDDFNNNKNGENMKMNMDNDYQHIPLNDGGKVKNVLEEVSVDHGEMEKYLQAPGGNNQDIELSFSSQGLRQISYRDVV